MKAPRGSGDSGWQESELVDFVLSLRQLDLALTAAEVHAFELYARLHARRYALALNAFASWIPPGARIFSVGSEPNQLEMVVARDFDARVVGSAFVPPDVRMLQQTRGRLIHEEKGVHKFTAVYESTSSWRCEMEVYLLDVTRDALPLGPGSCDVVFCFEVVEHFVNSPLSLFREIRRVLRPGGHLLLSTPNLQHWHRLLFWINGMTYPDIDFPEPVEGRHTHIFSFRELKELLDTAGFEIVTHFFDDPWENAKHVMQFDLNEPLNRAARDLVADREECRHECIFLAARPHRRTLILAEGWHGTERDAAGWWRWSGGSGDVCVFVDEDMDAVIQGELGSLEQPNRVDVVVNGEQDSSIEITWEGFKPFRPLRLRLRAGENIIRIVSRNPAVTIPTDRRPLAFAVKNVSMTAGNGGDVHGCGS